VAAAARLTAPRAGRAQRLHAAWRRAVRHHAQLSLRSSWSRTRRRKCAGLPGELAARRLGADLAQLRAATGRRHARPGEHVGRAGCALTRPPPPGTASPPPHRRGDHRPGGHRQDRVLAAIAWLWTARSSHRDLPERHQRSPGSRDREAVNTPGCSPPSGRGQIPPGSLIVADEGSISHHPTWPPSPSTPPQRLQAGPGRGPGATRRGRGRGAMMLLATGSATSSSPNGPVPRRLGTRRLPRLAPVTPRAG